MDETNKKLSFLVVSPSQYLRQILKFVLETYLKAEVTELESEEKALSFLKGLSLTPSLIVYDYSPNSFLVEDFVGHLRENSSKNVRIIILVDSIRQEGKEILKSTPQMTILKESDLPSDLIKECQNYFLETPFLNQDEFCRIDINFLNVLDGIYKDLYIKIGQDKFIKVFNESESTNSLDTKKYQDKGIQHLYLGRDTAIWVIEQIQKQMTIFLNATNFKFILRTRGETAEKRFEQKVLRIHEEVHIDNDFRLTIEKAVESVKVLVEKEKRVEKMLLSFKENKKDYAYFTQKMNLTCLISCLLAKELDWMSKTTLDKLIYASVLGDITLAVKPELMKINGLTEFEKIKDTLTDEEQKLFLTHPQDAAQLIARYFSGAPTDTDILTLQHHETPDGHGFPSGMRADKISALSALFIVANDFSNYYLAAESSSLEDFINNNRARYDFMNFRKIIKTLEKLRKR